MNGTGRAGGVPPSGGRGSKLEGEMAVRKTEAESVAWEMLGEALRTLEGVGHMGAEVIRQAQQAGGAAGQVSVLSSLEVRRWEALALEANPLLLRRKQRVELRRVPTRWRRK